MVCVGPCRQFHRGMEQMLYAVDGDRALASGDVEDPLDAQKIGAMKGDQHLDPVDEFRPIERRLMAQAEVAYAIVMAIAIERRVIVPLCVRLPAGVVMIMVTMRGTVRIGFFMQL